MNWLDIVLAIPLIWFMYKGFRNGLIIELASLAALILGIFIALHFSFYAKDFLLENFTIGDNYLNIIAFAITFITVAVVVYLIGKIIHKLVNIVALGFINRLAGGIFGLLKAAIVLSIIIYFINGFGSGILKSEVKQESFLYEHVEKIVPSIFPFIDQNDDGKIGKDDLPISV